MRTSKKHAKRNPRKSRPKCSPVSSEDNVFRREYLQVVNPVNVPSMGIFDYVHIQESGKAPIEGRFIKGRYDTDKGEAQVTFDMNGKRMTKKIRRRCSNGRKSILYTSKKPIIGEDRQASLPLLGAAFSKNKPRVPKPDSARDTYDATQEEDYDRSHYERAMRKLAEPTPRKRRRIDSLIA